MNKKSTKSTNSMSRHAAPAAKKHSVRQIVSTPLFGKIYIITCLIILAATTIFWAALGAKVQQSNSDQLVNFYLLGHWTNIHTATLPGAHSFLMKWPIYLLIGLTGSISVASLNYATIGIVLCTVIAFAAILYAIERRPLVFGAICLALASTLLLVPAEPYPGAVLPVNMAMLTTRNVEYIAYIVALLLFIRARRLRSWYYLLGVLIMAALIASDKLFLALSLGGSIIMIALHTFARRWTLVSLSALWLMGTVIAAVLAMLLLDTVNATHFAHVVNSGSVSPYSPTGSLHSFGLGSIYAILALFTVFGANPATDTRLLRQIPEQVFHNLFSVSGVTLIINAVLLLGGLVAAGILVHQAAYKGRHDPSDSKSSLSVMLLWSMIVGLGLFVGTNHYYPVDARYVGIAFFSLFVIGTTHIRKLTPKPEHLLIAGGVLLIGLAAGIPLASKDYHNETAALAPTVSRNQIVAQLLKHHSEHVLVGNYWRVLPIKLDSGNTIPVSLVNCTQPQSVQSSTTWPINLNKNSFAYLLTLDKSLTNSPSCSLSRVVKVYGQPNASSVVAGTILHPKELLLFYDRGINKTAPQSAQSKSASATVVPVPLVDLPDTNCSGPTVMNVVAHEDDDLVFMGPDTYNSIQAGYCVRTIYITAGDAGAGQYYSLDRERGAEAAYSYMLGSHAIWIQKLVKLSNQEVVTVANPLGNSKISLIFFHLPDGNLRGEGFAVTHFQSIAQLYGGKLPYITSNDGESKYTTGDLTNALESLMYAYQPTMIHTQATYDALQSVLEHSDHMTVGLFTQKAYENYEKDAFADQITIPIRFYIGYPTREMPQNVNGSELTRSTNVFLTYAHDDPAVCQPGTACLAQKNNYTLYLGREYSYAPQ